MNDIIVVSLGLEQEHSLLLSRMSSLHKHAMNTCWFCVGSAVSLLWPYSKLSPFVASLMQPSAHNQRSASGELAKYFADYLCCPSCIVFKILLFYHLRN